MPLLVTDGFDAKVMGMLSMVVVTPPELLLEEEEAPGAPPPSAGPWPFELELERLALHEPLARFPLRS